MGVDNKPPALSLKIYCLSDGERHRSETKREKGQPCWNFYTSLFSEVPALSHCSSGSRVETQLTPTKRSTLLLAAHYWLLSGNKCATNLRSSKKHQTFETGGID